MAVVAHLPRSKTTSGSTNVSPLVSYYSEPSVGEHWMTKGLREYLGLIRYWVRRNGFQKDLFSLLGLDASPASLWISTINGTSSWNSGIGELKLTSLSGQEYVHAEKAFCLESLPIQPVMYCSDAQYPFAVLPETSTCLRQSKNSFRRRCSENTLGSRTKPRWAKQPRAIRLHLGWTVLGPVDQSKSYARNINHVDSDADSTIKQLDLQRYLP